MKRINYKRKPPKVKSMVYDGSSIKTKYVRMSPAVAENVNIRNKEEITSPLLEVAKDVFPMLGNGNIK